MQHERMTDTHARVRSLTRRLEGVGTKLYMDSFFSSPDLFDDLHTRGINHCGANKIIKDAGGL
jgi:hypothetical protein